MAACKEVAVTDLGHPSRPVEVSGMNPARPLWIAARIESQHDRRHLSPVSVIGRGVEKAKVRFQVRPVIVGKVVR